MAKNNTALFDLIRNNCCRISFINDMYCNALKFVFSKKATKNYNIVTIDLTLTNQTSNQHRRFGNFCCLLRKHEV